MGSFETSGNTKPVTQPHFKKYSNLQTVETSKLTTGKKPQLRRHATFIIVCDLQSFNFRCYEMKVNTVTDCTAVTQND